MIEPSEPEKKREQEKDNSKKEHKAVGIVSQLVRYVPLRSFASVLRPSRLATICRYSVCSVSLWIFGSFILNQDWRAAAITFPIVVIMVAWSAYPKDFLLQIQERMDLKRKKGAESPIQQVRSLDFLNFRIANPNAEMVDFSGVDLSGVDLSGVDLSGVDFRYANLRYANLSGANFNRAEFRYADLSGADLRYANFSEANFKYANLSDANLNCTLLNGANLSDANLSGALLFSINLREVINLEPLQLKAKPSPFLCNVALPFYSQQLNLNPNRACDRIPQLLSDRYNISLEEAQWIVDEARQHRWN